MKQSRHRVQFVRGNSPAATDQQVVQHPNHHQQEHLMMLSCVHGAFTDVARILCGHAGGQHPIFVSQLTAWFFAIGCG